MKKFGGLFAAEGMLECFQIEICDSLDNPLQKGVDTAPKMTTTNVGPRMRSSTMPKVDISAISIGRPSSAAQSSPTSQRALMCHRFSTKITLRDVVGFGKGDGAKVSIPYLNHQ